MTVDSIAREGLFLFNVGQKKQLFFLKSRKFFWFFPPQQLISFDRIFSSSVSFSKRFLELFSTITGVFLILIKAHKNRNQVSKIRSKFVAKYELYTSNLLPIFFSIQSKVSFNFSFKSLSLSSWKCVFSTT